MRASIPGAARLPRSYATACYITSAPNSGGKQLNAISRAPHDPSGAASPSGFFALRTPLLPFDALPRSRAELKKFLAIPEAREAVFLAAPDLEARIDGWLREPDSPSGRKMELALLRYATRMCCRATPFGLFAACSVGSVLPETCLRV